MKNENTEGIKLKYLAPISPKKEHEVVQKAFKIPGLELGEVTILSKIKGIKFSVSQVTSQKWASSTVEQKSCRKSPAGQGLGSTFRQTHPLLLKGLP